MKEVLETMAFVEREAFVEEREDQKNGFYTRNLKILVGEIKDLSIPRTRKKDFRPFFLEPPRDPLYLGELVRAMYQGGCSTKDSARTLEALLEGNSSPGWVSRITDVLEEKIEEWRQRPLTEWYPILFVDGVVLKARRDTVDHEVVYLALGIDEEGYREVLGFWLWGSEGESAGNWREILLELRERRSMNHSW